MGARCFIKRDQVRVAGAPKVVPIHRLSRVTAESDDSLLDCQSLVCDDYLAIVHQVIMSTRTAPQSDVPSEARPFVRGPARHRGPWLLEIFGLPEKGGHGQ